MEFVISTEIQGCGKNMYSVQYITGIKKYIQLPKYTLTCKV